jgi:hypothetical protein
MSKKQISGGSFQKSGYQQAGCWDWMSSPQKKQQKAGMSQKAGCWECKKGGYVPQQHMGGRRAMEQKIQIAQLPSAMGMSPHLKRKREQLTEMALKTKRSTANPSYGWALRSPQKGKARHTLMSKCGAPCFLMPEREGFPVCAKYELNPSCSTDCGGVLSAYRRARQYGYPAVADAAHSLATRVNCSWSNKTTKKSIKK